MNEALIKASENSKENKEIAIRIVQALEDEHIVALKEIAKTENDSIYLSRNLINTFLTKAQREYIRWEKLFGPKNFRDSIINNLKKCDETIDQLKGKIMTDDHMRSFKKKHYLISIGGVILISSIVHFLTIYSIQNELEYLRDTEYLYKYELFNTDKDQKLFTTRLNYLENDSTRESIQKFVDESKKKIKADYKFYSE